MTASAEGLPLSGVRQRVEHATLARYEDHTLYDGHDCWRCAMVDRENLLALYDAALRDTGPRPDSEGLVVAQVRTHDPSKYTLHNSEDGTVWQMTPDGSWTAAALRDTGPRPDSGIDDHEHDHDCQSGNGKTHRHEYRHTHPVEHLHRHEHPTDEQVARRIALSTPRTETSDTVRIGSKTYLAGADDD
jgi:hypothetical protein